jgi:hypothetical protein
VQRGDRVEEHRLHGRGEQLHQRRNTARFEDGEQALPMEFFLDINFNTRLEGSLLLHADSHSRFYWRILKKTIPYYSTVVLIILKGTVAPD